MVGIKIGSKKTKGGKQRKIDGSPWAVAGSVIKYYRFSWDFVMRGISMQNLMMLMQAIPDLDDEEEVEIDEFDELFKEYKQ